MSEYTLNVFIDFLRNASRKGGGANFIYSEDDVKRISYEDLYKRSLFLAKYVKDKGLAKKENVILDCEKPENMLVTFWACQIIGCVPVLVSNKHGELPEKIVEKLGKCWIIRDYFLELPDYPEISICLTDYDFEQETFLYNDEADGFCGISMDETCLILLSSGTVSNYKIIPLTGNNILICLKGIQKMVGPDESGRVLQWMPLYHCGGFITQYMSAVYSGCEYYNISTTRYIENPLLLLSAYSKYKITFSGMIPSAMRELINRFQCASAKEYDFSSLQTIFLGAENISIQLCYEFIELFGKYGLSKDTLKPSYGITEAASSVGWTFYKEGYECYKPKNSRVEFEGEFEPAQSDDSNAVIVYDFPDTLQIRITGQNGEELPVNQLGNIQLKGESIIDHYYIDMDQYGTVFSNGWYETGDIGFVTKNGKFGVVGRIRDILKINGEFYSAPALENIVKKIPSSKVDEILVTEYKNERNIDYVGVFIVCPKWLGEEGFIPQFIKYSRKIRNQIAAETGLVFCEIIPIPGAPKTDSQKIKRYALNDLVDEKIMQKIKENVVSMDKNAKGIEKIISEIINEVTQIQIDDFNIPFTNYGIVSKNVPVIVEKINQKFDIEVSIAAMFNFPSINLLSDYIINIITDNRNKAFQNDYAKVNMDEDIAIVGMSNRFPGGSNTPEEFFEFLMSGEDAITDIPKDRWDADQYYSENDEEPGKMYCKKAGFIDANYQKMDNNFFNLSPKEASSIDPHQRILLELTWEAFENGGLNISEYDGSKTGVFLGLADDEYGLASISSGDLTKINTYSLTGVCHSTACGRISYTFGFEGPCFSVDTACSSFLTALHLATVSLRNHESDAAVVGGASLILTPVISVSFSKLKALSHDGHCKTFDDSADGYGRGEGAGVVILKRLSDAERDHDNILGVIRASGINQDGRSNGLTAPNGESQRIIIEDTLKRSGLKKSDIDYVETHGTGTSLGDPIEVNAIKEGYCEDSDRQNPLYIGSVKSNIGHLEAASSAASLIKVLLSMKHEMIPANRGFFTPSKKIKWTDDIKVVGQPTPWKKGNHVRRAAINSFGFGGSNAHVIVEEYVKPDLKVLENANPYVLKISAKTKDSLKELVNKYLILIRDTDEEELASVIATANKGRADFNYRIAVTGENKQELISALNSFLLDKKNALGLNVYDEKIVRNGDSKVAFMFTGQSSQYVKMAHTLFENNPVFREAFLECDKLFTPYIMCSLVDLVYSEDSTAETIENTVYAQPLIFSVEYALVKFWESVGVKPSLVIGHSIGEYAAAVTAGIMDLEAAVKLVSLRGRLMNDAPGKGSMTTLFTDRVNAERLIGEYSSTVNIAVHNSEGLCVISGVADDVEAVAKRAEAEEIKTRKLNVSHGFHSELMRPAAQQFKKVAGNVIFHPAKIRFLSSMYERALAENELLDVDYWANHICNEVKFYETISSIPNYEEYLFLEIGATNTLTSLCKYIFGGDCNGVNSLDVKNKDVASLNNAVAKLYVHSVPIQWNNYVLEHDEEWNRTSKLPNYPFKRTRYWNEMQYDRVQGNMVIEDEVDSLLGQRIESPIMEDTVIFQKMYTPTEPFFMSEHIIFGTAIAPAAAYMALVISAMKAICNPDSISIQEIELRAPLAVTEKSKVQVCISGASTGVANYKIMSLPMGSSGAEWIIHTQGKVVINNSHLNPTRKADVENWEKLPYDINEGGEHPVYSAMTAASFNLGVGFKRLMKSYRNNGEGVFYVDPDENLPLTEDYVIYPGVIDSVFHTMLYYVIEETYLKNGFKDSETMIPYYIGEFSYDYRNFGKLYVNAISHVENQSIIGDAYAYNLNNEPIIAISNMIAKQTNHQDLLGKAGVDREKEYYHYAWIKAENEIDSQSNYKSICIIGEKDKDLVDFEKYSSIPVKRLTLDQLEHVKKDTQDLDYPVLFLYCAEEKSGVPYNPMKHLFDFIKAQDHFDSSKKCFLRIVTKKAVPFMNTDLDFSQSLLWGFAKSFISEYPENFKGIIDLEGKEKVSEIIDFLLYGKNSEMCIRNKTLFVSSLLHHSEYMRTMHTKTEEVAVLPEATYVISGGTGSVGQAYIEALSESGAKHFAILSRRTPKEEFIERMKELDIDAKFFSCDISVKEEVMKVISEIKADMPSIKGVINVSGVFRDKMLEEMSWDDFEYVLAPKVLGSMNLYEAVKDLEIDFFHMTSSITSILGNIGQTNYATANYFMNAFAEYLTNQGIKANVICWGPWSGSSVVSSDAVERNMLNGGLKPYALETGKNIIKDSLAKYCGSFMSISVEWDKFAKGMANPYTEQLMQKLVFKADTKAESKITEDFSKIIEGMTKKEVRRILRDRISQICREVMGYGDVELDENTAFKELGADSLMIFSMRNAVNKMIQGDVGVSDFYSYATIEKLTNHIVDDILVIEERDEVVEESLDDLANELDSLLD